MLHQHSTTIYTTTHIHTILFNFLILFFVALSDRQTDNIVFFLSFFPSLGLFDETKNLLVNSIHCIHH